MEGITNTSHPFSDTGFNDIMIGTQLFKELNVAPENLSNPFEYSKLKEIAEFLNNHPDPNFVIGRIKNNKSNMSNLDFVYGYVGLNKEKIQLLKKLEDLDTQIKFYE